MSRVGITVINTNHWNYTKSYNWTLPCVKWEIVEGCGRQEGQRRLL